MLIQKHAISSESPIVNTFPYLSIIYSLSTSLYVDIDIDIMLSIYSLIHIFLYIAEMF